ncbi:MAG: YciI family protein [Flavobacteriales bacterium]
MRTLLLFVFTVSFFPVFSQEEDTVRHFSIKEGDTVFHMKRYYLCIYLTGKNRGQDSVTAAEIQKGHLAHIGLMSEKGVICMAGPFGDNTDKRGILMFDVATLKEAETWIKKDPAVMAGRLTYEIHPWWGARGSILK